MNYKEKSAIIFGADGQLGYDVLETFIKLGWKITAPLIKELDISDFEKTSNFIRKIKPDFVINCAAFTDVNKCESEINKAYQINAVAPGYMAKACSGLSAVFVHFSTDYVFSGENRNTPYTEEDTPDPLMVYGLSKLAGEQLIPIFCSRYYIFRLASLYGIKGPSGKPYNFVDIMLKLGREKGKVYVINDHIMTPTHSLDVAEHLPKIITSNKFGLYNLTSEGYCSWFEFAQKIFELSKIKVKVNPVSLEHFPSQFKRPRYTVLENKKYNSLFSKKMPSWEDALKRYLSLKGECK